MSNAKIIEIMATPQQIAFLLSRKRHRIFVGGVGAGKTYAGCLLLLSLPRGSRALVIAPTYRMLIDAIWNNLYYIANQVGIVEANKADMNMNLPNGVEVLFRSATHPERLRGIEVGCVWADEGAYLDEETYLVALGRLRKEPMIAALTTTPAGYNWFYRRFIQAPSDSAELVIAPTFSNLFLPSHYLATLREAYSELLYRQEVLAEFVDIGGQIFKAEWIRYADPPPDLFSSSVKRYLGADLAISQRDTADYTAIVVVAEQHGRWYVLEALQGRWTFAEQIHQISKLAEEYQAICYIESQGYQYALVQELMRKTNLNIIPVKVRADKIARFQPIAARYEHNLIYHCRRFSALESQLIAMGEKMEHDDLVDALVMALTGAVQSAAPLLTPGSIQIIE